MLIDYEERFYYKLAQRKKELVSNNYILAREIAAWKRRVSAVWDNVKILDSQRVRVGNESMMLGEQYHFEVKLDVATLSPEEIGVELVVAKQMVGQQTPDVILTEQLQLVKTEGTHATYALDISPNRTGAFDLALRVYPKNENLPYRMDFALVKWA
jgi:phosphorylase/glycogen(starch) synthase